MTAISKHSTLWRRYCKDFAANEFGLDVEEDKQTFINLLNLMIAKPLEVMETRKRLVELHTAAHTNQINLTKLVSNLRSLHKLRKVVNTMPSLSKSTQSASTKFMSEVEKSPEHVHNPVTLYQFIIGTLFEALAEVCLNYGHEETNYSELQDWRDAYRDMVSTYSSNLLLSSYSFLALPCLPFLPLSALFHSMQTSQTSVKQILFHFTLREVPYVGKLNSTAAVFFLLQVRAKLDEETCDLAIQLGKILLERYFDEELQVNSCEISHVQNHTDM